MTRNAENRPLLGLFRALMLLVLIAYLAAVARLWHDNLQATRTTLTHVNSMLVQGVRTTLTSHELILRGIAGELVSQGALESPEKGRGLIERLKDIDPGMAGFGLARPDGQLVLVSGIPADAPLPNLATRDRSAQSFHEAAQSGQLRTGRAYFFEQLGGWVVPVRVPIRDESGRLLAVMTAGYAIEGGTTAWANMDLPPDVQVALMRDDGYLLYMKPLQAGERAAVLQRTYGEPVADSTLQQALRTTAERAFVEISLPRNGGMHYLAYARIPEYKLHAGAFVHRSAVVGNWLQRLLAPTALLLVVLGGGLWAYRHASSRQQSSDEQVGRLSAWQQAVLDGGQYSIISTDTEGCIVSFNRAAERMLGYRAHELVGKATPQVLHDPREIAQRAAELTAEFGGEVAAGFEALVAKARRGLADEREWTYVRKDGSRFPVQLSVTPLVAADGRTIGFLGIGADLTEQAAMRASLRDSEARYRTLFERAGDAIFLFGDGRFVDCNPATLQMFGVTRDQIIGATPGDFSPPRQPDGQASRDKAKRLIAAAAQGASQLFEWRHRRGDGTPFDTEVSLNAVEIAGRPHLLATVRDISERKRNEAELTRSRQELIERNDSLRLLNSLSQRLHGIQDPTDILRETGQALLGLSRAPQVAIYLLDADGRSLRLAFNHGFDSRLARLGATLPLHGSLSGLALTRGQPLCTVDVASDERVEPGLRQALAESGIKSGIVVPIICQGRSLGTINLVHDRVRDPGDIERETLVSLSNTVGLAIANSRQRDHLAFLAWHDGLTGLANRTQLHERFAELVERAFDGGGEVALLLLDLDRFKEINDTLGHHVGDRVLTQIAGRLEQACAGRSSLVSRLGGDEFALLVSSREAGEPVQAVAEGIVQALQRPFTVDGIEIRVGASVGVACYPDHGADSHALLRSADVAMYQAKRRGQGVFVYDYASDEYSTERLALANELAEAVQQRQLVLHYQPKIDIASGATVGFEALVRWQHPRRGLLYPGEFIDLVEMNEVVHPFTGAVVDLAVADKRRLRDLGFEQPVAINLSARNLVDARCLSSLEAALEAHGVPPTEIELELTETAVMHDPDAASEQLRRFTDRGMQVAIDDFGTGYSSLVYLRKLPISALKIDRSFVMDMLHNEQDRTIVSSTAALAHNLNLGVVAEGVEDAQTLALLRTIGCDQAQGFGLCRPQPFDELVSWLSAGGAVAAAAAVALDEGGDAA